ncbi:alpha-L-rhamnosidase [Paenibacillus taihuensis]|uniref:alpha-L-rhamnosidase n=1 Tax=Paenibacillus taihuensis TaxID=1156355 RepID=A0A3D9SLK1_9BACL|nr:glycoside hydrolase family 78 protein [Paenibacillus taihuensis]REE92775.1 alpha-L-rhamnosidase [Paenibacillus taihuensis]
MFGIYELRCDYRINPIGLGARIPRLSWKLQSDRRGTVQSAYRLQVSLGEQFDSIVWDSEVVRSEQSVHVEPQELAILPRTRYYYRVEAWNEAGEGSGWSETAFWETGLTDAGKWDADWIAAPEKIGGDVFPEAVPMLRRDFAIDGIVTSARIYATALGIYELELNGQRVGDSYFSPGWTSYDHRLQVQTYEVTELLQSGDNAIGAQLANGWYRGYLGWDGHRELYGSQTALLLQLHIELADGRSIVIASDDSWRAATGPILMSELYHGETYDANLEKEGWSQAGFDGSDWLPVKLIEHSKSILIPQENVPVRKIEELAPIAILHTPSGDTVLDMGQNMVGWVRFTVRGDEGQTVMLRHAEVLDKEGNFYNGNIRAAKQLITYTKKSNEPETFEPRFTFQGFRYVQLSGFGESVRPDDFIGVVLHSDMQMTGSFACSEPLVNQLQHNITWGLKGNFLDVPTDCPQRDERLGWTGDAQVFARTAGYLANVAPFFGKWLGDLSADQDPDGGVPFVVPNMLEKKPSLQNFGRPVNSAAWGDAAVIVPWTVYQCYGDKRILEDQYESMRAWVEYIRGQGGTESLWDTGFHFADWLALDGPDPNSPIGGTDMHYVATAYFSYSTSIVQKTADLLGRWDDARDYASLYDAIRSSFEAKYVQPSGEMTIPTQTAQVIGLYFGLLHGDAREKAISKLMELLEESDHHLKTGFVGTPYLNFALSENGQNDEAYKLLLQQDYPSWLYQVTKGATTIWEHWDGIKQDGSFWSDSMNSFNHYAYGAIGDWLYRNVAGIHMVEDQPGYKQIRIQPQPGPGLTWAEGKLETMYGTLISRWSREQFGSGGGMEVTVVIPPNTRAEIVLPGSASIEDITESGIALADAEGIQNIELTTAGLKLLAASGDYRFVYQTLS